MTKPKKRAMRKKPLSRSAVDVLYRAVARWVQQHGGVVIVAGGTEVQEWPGSAEGHYRVAIRCFGRKPSRKASQ